LKGNKENGCDIRNNYSGNIYSGMYTFVSQREQNVQAVYVNNGKKSFKYPRNRISKVCQILVAGDAIKELNIKGDFVVIILALNILNSH
jgi:hypothetical protein